MASNGEYVTLYDFTGSHEHAYRKIHLKNDSFFELMGFLFHPDSFINLLLGKIPLDGGKNLVFRVANDKLEIEASLENGWELRSMYDHHNHQILETRFLNRAHAISYQVKYSEFRKNLRYLFPKIARSLCKKSIRIARFNIEFQQVELNGAPILPEVFYITPH